MSMEAFVDVEMRTCRPTTLPAYNLNQQNNILS